MTEGKLGLNLDDIVQAAGKAVSYSKGLSYANFLADPRTQQAIAMNFIIIGECAAKIMKDFPGLCGGTPRDTMDQDARDAQSGRTWLLRHQP